MANTRVELFADGLFHDGYGACSWYVLITNGTHLISFPNGTVTVCPPFEDLTRGSLYGQTTSLNRMTRRAIFEGLARTPEGADVTVYCDNYLIDDGKDMDLRNAIAKVISDRRLNISSHVIKPRLSDDLPLMPDEILAVCKMWTADAFNEGQRKENDVH